MTEGGVPDGGGGAGADSERSCVLRVCGTKEVAIGFNDMLKLFVAFGIYICKKI
jgi:hypothetical protein